MKLSKVRDKERERRRLAADLIREQGLTYEEARARTGMSYATITKALREAGIEMRRRERVEERKLDRFAILAELDGEQPGEDEAWITAQLAKLRGTL